VAPRNADDRLPGGEPCAGEPHARFGKGGLGRSDARARWNTHPEGNRREPALDDGRRERTGDRRTKGTRGERRTKETRGRQAKGTTRRANGKPEESPPASPEAVRSGPKSPGENPGIWGRTHVSVLSAEFRHGLSEQLLVAKFPGERRRRAETGGDAGAACPPESWSAQAQVMSPVSIRSNLQVNSVARS